MTVLIRPLLPASTPASSSGPNDSASGPSAAMPGTLAGSSTNHTANRFWVPASVRSKPGAGGPATLSPGAGGPATLRPGAGGPATLRPGAGGPATLRPGASPGLLGSFKCTRNAIGPLPGFSGAAASLSDQRSQPARDRCVMRCSSPTCTPRYLPHRLAAATV